MRALSPNSNQGDKRALRARLLSLLAAPACVLETHCGAGTMTTSYHAAQSWLGADLDKRHRAAIHADSRQLLRAIDLAAFNFFDIDAYGSPLEWVWLISQRRKSPAPLALALTSGAFAGAHRARPTLKDAGFSQQLLKALGNPDPSSLFAGVWKDEHALLCFRACLRSWFQNFEIDHLEISPGYKPNTKNDLIAWYVGAILRPKAEHG